MPIYEYQCDACQHQFDAFQKITDAPLETCPECGGPVHKLVSRTSFVLKGGGWYATEYGNLKPPKGESKESPKADAGKADKKSTTGKKESSAKAA
jgi:putative FmdB family regulatory protein